MCSRSPAQRSLAPVCAGEDTCPPRWKRCQTASCANDPGSIFHASDLFHFEPFLLHYFLCFLENLIGTLGQNSWVLNQTWPPCAACFESRGEHKDTRTLAPGHLHPELKTLRA